MSSLKRARLLAGMTTQEVAQRLNVTRQTVYNWESGRVNPDIPTLLALSELYGKSVDYLLKGE
jgi:transcriptional regulator with XRE-family HTH domain